MENGKKILLIMGASSDCGCELIRRVAKKYDLVLAHYHHMNSQLEALELKYGDKLQLLQADFMDRERIDYMIEVIKKKEWNPTHIVHFSAQKFRYTKYDKVGYEEFEAELQTSLCSLIKVTQAFLPFMKKQKAGKIVVMLTVHTQGVPPRFIAPYVTVKYAMLGLVKALAADYAEKGIQVNGVSPEMIDTKFLSNMPDFVKEQSVSNYPMKRFLQVEDVIPTFEYLLSEAADCVTGQNICITGGR